MNKTAQQQRIYDFLRFRGGAWVPLPDILNLRIANYRARISELRQAGKNIENRTETVAGVRNSWYRLVEQR